MASTVRTKQESINHGAGAAYEKVASELKSEILNGTYTENDRLPSEKELAKRYSISRWSVRCALDALVQEGLVRKMPSRGNVVVYSEDRPAGSNGTRIGVIADSFLDLRHNSYLQNLMRQLEIHAAADSHHFTLVHEFVDMRRNTWPTLLSSSEVDAVIIIPLSQQGLNFVNNLKPLDKPVISFGRELTNTSIPQIYVDHYEGAASAVTYLAQLGHSRIATISHHEYQGSPSCHRMRAYRDTMKSFGHAIDSSWMLEGSVSYHEMNTRISKLFKLETPPTAIFVADGCHLLPTLHALAEDRISIPDQVAVISYDDTPEALNYHVPITTVRQPLDRASEALLGEILARIENQPGRPKTVLHPELTVRKSCCVCASHPLA